MKIQILTVIIAALSPFLAAACAYYFSVSKKHRLENQEAAYTNYYGPLLSLLIHYKLSSVWYGILRHSIFAHQTWPDIPIDNSIQNLIRQNIKYLPKETGPTIHKLLMTSDELFYLQGEGYERYEKHAIDASESFDFIIIESLKEASRLSKKLGYPDIAISLLNEFQKSLTSRPYDRHKV